MKDTFEKVIWFWYLKKKIRNKLRKRHFTRNINSNLKIKDSINSILTHKTWNDGFEGFIISFTIS